MSLTELIKDNKVTFDSYRAGFFYYNIEMGSTIPSRAESVEKGWIGGLSRKVIGQFTVPLDDIGNATLLAEDKAITYMRWIRKAIEDNTLIKKEL